MRLGLDGENSSIRAVRRVVGSTPTDGQGLSVAPSQLAWRWGRDRSRHEIGQVYRLRRGQGTFGSRIWRGCCSPRCGQAPEIDEGSFSLLESFRYVGLRLPLRSRHGRARSFDRGMAYSSSQERLSTRPRPADVGCRKSRQWRRGGNSTQGRRGAEMQRSQKNLKLLESA